MRKGVLYESVKRFVKTRKEGLNAFFTTSYGCVNLKFHAVPWRGLWASPVSSILTSSFLL